MFPIPPDKKQESFIQEYLYIEDIYFENKPPQKDNEEKSERGVVIIDILQED